MVDCIPQLILASGSPRRRDILELAGIPFVTRVADIVEQRRPEEKPEEYVCRLALEKAQAVRVSCGELVLAADTIVVLDDRILEKPMDSVDASRMLSALSGREHEVITGICLLHPKGIISAAERTRVRFMTITAEEIAQYVETGEPMDKAGAYAIQGLACRFVAHVKGCYFNVVGLPISLVYRHLRALRESGG